jgi:uncharacterized protein
MGIRSAVQILVFSLFILLVVFFPSCSHHPAGSPLLDKQLLDASEQGDAAAVERLLRQGADVNARVRDSTPLLNAVTRGRVAVAKVLLDNGATLSAGAADSDSVWSSALLAGQPAIVELLLQRGVGKEAKNAALFFVIREQPTILKYPSGGQTSADIDDYDGYSAVVNVLLKNGVDIEARDESGSTPLIEAAGYGRLAIVQALLKRGANIEARDAQSGVTPLLAAACDCAVATMPDTDVVVQLLLERGADIDATDNSGNTALIIASGGGVEKGRIVKLLLQKGANSRVRNKAGQTALSVAQRDGVSDVVKLLKRFSASRR